MKRLDIRAAHLTPNQRTSMLALKEQDQRIRQARRLDRFSWVLAWLAASLVFWMLVVRP